jgi:hypothetical protein
MSKITGLSVPVPPEVQAAFDARMKKYEDQLVNALVASGKGKRLTL